MSSSNDTENFDTVLNKSPPIFNEILSKLASEKCLLEKDMLTLKYDLLFTVLLLIMIENGFQPKASSRDVNTSQEPCNIDVVRLSKWKHTSGLYELDFQLLGFSDISIKIVMIPLCGNALVNVILSELDSETYSVCLPIDNYVILGKNTSAVVNMFHNLQALTDTFKNKVLAPVKSKLLSFCGYPGASLTDIPEDVFFKIMFYLSISDIVSVSKTCKKFKQFLCDDIFWHKLFLRDYKSSNTKLESNWRALYKKTYMNSKIQTRQRPLVLRYRFPLFAGWMY